MACWPVSVSPMSLATEALERLAALRRSRGDVGIADELDAQVAARRQPPPE